MINYIKYTVDGQSYFLDDLGGGMWSKGNDAPDVAGNYAMTIEINENGYVYTYDSTSEQYDIWLKVIEATERIVHLAEYVPGFIAALREMKAIYDTEDTEIDKVYAAINRIQNDVFIKSASATAIARQERFFNVIAVGTLEQRKKYLCMIMQRRNKLNENAIKDLVKTITGAASVVSFFGSSQMGNPCPGYGTIKVQILSPDDSDYRFEDVERSLKPLVPAHIRLYIVKYFATWDDVASMYTDWDAVKTGKTSWQDVRNMIGVV